MDRELVQSSLGRIDTAADIISAALKSLAIDEILSYGPRMSRDQALIRADLATRYHLNQLENTIETLARAEEHVKMVRQGLIQRAAFICSSSSRIAILPPKMLEIIFTLLLSDHPDHVPAPTAPTIIRSISQVCRSWRDITLAQPSFWTYVSTIFDSRMLELWLERAKESPVHVHIIEPVTADPPWYPRGIGAPTHSPLDPTEFINRLSQHRWMSLHIDICPPTTYPHLQALRARDSLIHGPHRTSLRICCREGGAPASVPSDTVLTTNHALRHFSLTFALLDPSVSTLNRLYTMKLDPHEPNASNNFFNLMEYAPLERLHFKSTSKTTPPGNFGTREVWLHNLWFLRMEWIMMRRANNVLQHLTAFRLTTLCMELHEMSPGDTNKVLWNQYLLEFCTTLSRFLFYNNTITHIAIQGPAQTFEAVLAPELLKGGKTFPVKDLLPKLQILAAFDDGTKTEQKARAIRKFLENRSGPPLKRLALSQNIVDAGKGWFESRADRLDVLSSGQTYGLWEPFPAAI